MMRIRIRQWYHETYPTDNLWQCIKPWVTFKTLFDALDNYQDVYQTIGEGIDSIVRERCFMKLAQIIGTDYDYIYDQWMRAGT